MRAIEAKNNNEPETGTVHAVSDRLRAARQQLDERRHQRGIALLDGKPFANDDIAALEAEIDALTIAEGEAARRDREAFEGYLEKQREAKRKIIRELQAQHIEAVCSAETAAIALMECLRDLQAIAEKLNPALSAFGIRSWNTPPANVAERFSQRLTGIMRPILTMNNRYGAIEFPSFLHNVNPSDGWEAAEIKLLATDLAKALQPTSRQQGTVE